MRHRDVLSVFCTTLLCAVNVHAATSSSQYLIDQMIQGGPISIRNAAKSIYHMRETDHEVLDVLAETMLQKYPTANDRDGADAMAWACKGLAAAGDKRYFSAIKEVADSGATHRQTRKHCARAADDLQTAEGAQYAKGMASLTKTPAKPSAANVTKNKPARVRDDNGQASSNGYQPITEVKIGMSMEQAYAIAGTPTATTSYQTGKAFIPFNFRGADIVRSASLYKGQGRIVFNNDSRYNGNMRVLEILINPNESGYP